MVVHEHSSPAIFVESTNVVPPFHMARTRPDKAWSSVKVLKIRVGAFATVATLALLGAGVSTAQACAPIKVTLCHRAAPEAGGDTHAGYSIITVDISSMTQAKSVRGHDSHNQVGDAPFGDVIPSYKYDSYTYPGKNLANGGTEFLANGCKGVTPPPATTTTKPCPPKTTPPVTTTTPATTPPATTTTSATTPPAATTTSSTTTTPPETTTTTPTVTTTTPVSVAGTTASTTVAPTPVNVLGAAASANPLPAGAAAGQANTGKLIGAGLTGLTALLALGAGFLLRRRHGVS
jgi:hypothetical protein